MLKTSRLFLNSPQAHDKPELIKLWQDHRIQKYLGGILPSDIVEEKLEKIFAHWNKHGFGLCSIYERAEEKLIGLCGLQYSEDGLELSYKFNAKYWQKGFGYESSKGILEYGFNHLNKNEIIAITQSQNERSIILLNKIGMTFVRKFIRYNSSQSMYRINRNFII
jgi:RimJ/RimL family protein N-acetyltransferase